MHGGISNAITCNTVTQNNFWAVIIGIGVWESPDVLVSENTANDLYSGISMLGDNNTSCILSYNDLNDDPLNAAVGTGLFYRDALTGPQYLQGNDWIGDFINGSRYIAGASSYTYCNSRYHVSPGANVDNTTNPVNQGSPQSCGNWFNVIDETETDYTCGDNNSSERMFSKNEADLDLAGGGTVALSPGYRWTTELGIYQKFTEHPELVAGDETIIAFLEAQAGEPVAHMYATRQELNTVTVPGSSLAGDIENTLAQLRVNETGTAALLDQLDTDPAVAVELAALSAEAEVLEAQLAEYLSTAGSEAVSSAFEASANNSSIDCNSLPCTLERYLNGLYLETQIITPRALTADELEEVRDIALQCPAEAGAAPRLAKAWYYLQTGERLYNTCSSFVPEPEIEERQRKPVQTDVTQEVSLLPNPAGNSVTLKVPAELQGGRYAIKDLWGRVLLQQKIVAETVSIPLVDFANGTYFVSARNDAGLLLVKKLVVLH